MKETSIFYREVTYSGKNSGKMVNSLKHSLRITNELESYNINWDKEKSTENILNRYNENEIIDTTNEIESIKLSILDDIMVEYNNDIEEEKLERNIANKDKKKLSNMFNSFGRYAKTAQKNNNKKELDFWNNVIEKIKNKEFSEETLRDSIEIIETFEGKTKESKIKKLKDYYKFFIEMNDKKNQKKLFDSKKIRMVESIFKIPITNNIELSTEETRIILEDFNKKYFNEYDMVLSFEHKDEVYNIYKDSKNGEIKETKNQLGNHTHLFTKTFNKITKEYDYTEKKHQVIRDFMSKKGLNDEEIDEKIGKVGNQSGLQSKNLGVFYQDLFYEYVNNHSIFKDKDLNAVKFANYTKDEQISHYIDQQKTHDGMKKTHKNIHNGATLKLEYSEQLEKINKEKEKAIENNNDKIRNQKNKYKENIKEYEQLPEKIEEINRDIEDKESYLKLDLNKQVEKQERFAKEQAERNITQLNNSISEREIELNRAKKQIESVKKNRELMELRVNTLESKESELNKKIENSTTIKGIIIDSKSMYKPTIKKIIDKSISTSFTGKKVLKEDNNLSNDITKFLTSKIILERETNKTEEEKRLKEEYENQIKNLKDQHSKEMSELKYEKEINEKKLDSEINDLKKDLKYENIKHILIKDDLEELKFENEKLTDEIIYKEKHNETININLRNSNIKQNEKIEELTKENEELTETNDNLNEKIKSKDEEISTYEEYKKKVEEFLKNNNLFLKFQQLLGLSKRDKNKV